MALGRVALVRSPRVLVGEEPVATDKRFRSWLRPAYSRLGKRREGGGDEAGVCRTDSSLPEIIVKRDLTAFGVNPDQMVVERLVMVGAQRKPIPRFVGRVRR